MRYKKWERDMCQDDSRGRNACEDKEIKCPQGFFKNARCVNEVCNQVRESAFCDECAAPVTLSSTISDLFPISLQEVQNS